MINSRTNNVNSYWTMIMLYLSFVWVGIFPVISSLSSGFFLSYGNLFNLSSLIFSSGIINVLVSALVSWIGFELIFMVYRFILSFKIYSFILPIDKLKSELRTFFIFRNLILGIIFNICFIFPYLYALSRLFELIVTTIIFILFSLHINKTYSESIVGHFVFKSFVSPLILYEVAVVIINFLGVI